MADSPSAHLPHRRVTDTREWASRCLDIAVSTTAMLVLSPFMLLIALAIYLESGGPVLFRQVRLGQHGRPFYIYKFRKFHKQCAADGSPLTFEDDTRMTAVGKFLRATKLDELPQFWNVIRGDMAVIGPRPESLAFADCFAGPYERVLDYRPGILGPSQVEFRNESALYAGSSNPDAFYREVIFPTKARMDLDYYCNRTLSSDVAWIIRGALAVLGLEAPRTGREKGIEAGEKTPRAIQQGVFLEARNRGSTQGKRA